MVDPANRFRKSLEKMPYNYIPLPNSLFEEITSDIKCTHCWVIFSLRFSHGYRSHLDKPVIIAILAQLYCNHLDKPFCWWLLAMVQDYGTKRNFKLDHN